MSLRAPEDCNSSIEHSRINLEAPKLKKKPHGLFRNNVIFSISVKPSRMF